jgi:hypothetical protein
MRMARRDRASRQRDVDAVSGELGRLLLCLQLSPASVQRRFQRLDRLLDRPACDRLLLVGQRSHAGLQLRKRRLAAGRRDLGLAKLRERAGIRDARERLVARRFNAAADVARHSGSFGSRKANTVPVVSLRSTVSSPP